MNIRARRTSPSGVLISEIRFPAIVTLASRVVVFHQGKEIARGTPREVTSNERVIEAYLGHRQAKQMAGTQRMAGEAP